MTISGAIQYSVHPPNLYIVNSLHRLLPSWSVPVSSVLIVLQQTQHCLLKRTIDTELEKDRLRQRFLAFATQIAAALVSAGYLAEVFDPRTGLPTLTPAGSLAVDDVAIAHAALAYRVTHRTTCPAIVHPVWGSAVYPSTLLSSAPCHVLERIAADVIGVSHAYHPTITPSPL